MFAQVIPLESILGREVNCPSIGFIVECTMGLGDAGALYICIESNGVLEVKIHML